MEQNDKPLDVNSHFEVEDHFYKPDVYYADDLPPEILALMSPLQEGSYVFELGKRFDIQDNLGIAFKGNVDTDSLKTFLAARVNRRKSEFEALVKPLTLEAARIIQIGETPVYAYSYDKDTVAQDFAKVAEALAQVGARTPKASLMPRNIILLPDLGIITDAGTPANGETHTELATTQLYRRAFMDGPYRIPGVSSLSGVVTHEWGHQFVSGGFHQLFEDWLKLGSWEQVEWGRYQTRKPDQCLNDYARTSPHEDFCESTAAALLNSDHLQTVSPQKFDLLRKFFELKSDINPNTRVSYRILPSDKPTGPEFPTHFRYTLVTKP